MVKVLDELIARTPPALKTVNPGRPELRVPAKLFRMPPMVVVPSAVRLAATGLPPFGVTVTLHTSPGATAAAGATIAAFRTDGSSAGRLTPNPFGEPVRVRIRRLPTEVAAKPLRPLGPATSAAIAAA